MRKKYHSRRRARSTAGRSRPIPYNSDPFHAAADSLRDRSRSHPRRPRQHRRSGAQHAVRAFTDVVRDRRRGDLAQVREPAVHRVVQGTRRAQPAQGPDRRRERARRHRGVGGQPCAGRGLSRVADGHPVGDRHAAVRTGREGGQHAAFRRRGRAARRDVRRRQGAHGRAGHHAQPVHRPSLRRRGHHRGAGHLRPRDDGGRAVARHARDRHRRRRPDRRHLHRRESAEAVHQHRRRAGRALPGDVRGREERAARKRLPTPSPKASRSSRRVR